MSTPAADAKRLALSYLFNAKNLLNDTAIDIWNHPEIALTETHASQKLADILEEAGFKVTWGAGGMKTAFVAEWGSDGPKIGILGEYDALPGLSQRVTALLDPIKSGGPGHGCGHNLFGTASMGAAIAAKTALEMGKLPGTIRFYGCPAEETLVGKTYMARDGVFDDLDAALAWHPGHINTASIAGSCVAMNSFRVNFHGVAAHAGASPWLGRSALDGCMLMDVGVNYLREHIIPDARIHSVITKGGQAPNVVPADCQIWYFVRAPKRKDVDEIYARVLDIAKGAALMSGTTHDIEFVTGCYDLVNNRALGESMMDNMRALGPIPFDADDYAFAAKLRESISDEMRAYGKAEARKYAAPAVTDEQLGEHLCAQPIAPTDIHHVMGGSTEVADVSQITPTGNLSTACVPHGTPGHSWQWTASSGHSIGLKGMMYAAQIMAGTALDAFTNPDLLARAKAEHKLATGGRTYKTPLPEGAKPS